MEEEKNMAFDEPADDKNVDFEDVGRMDSMVFDEGTGQNQLTDNAARESEFMVLKPTMTGGHIVYFVKGCDNQGPWEGQRRYNEFYLLRGIIEQRWPGVPIPQLPPKKSIGNKDIKFINERRFYLERFLKKISAFDFIINSKEFGIFSHPTGNIENLLKAVVKAPSA